MKIVIVDTTIDEDLIGGAHIILPKLLKGLVDAGHTVHLVTKGIPNEKVLDAILQSGTIIHSNLWKKNILVEKAAPIFAKWLNELMPDIYLISASADIGWVVLPLLNADIATITIGHTDSETFYLPARHYHTFLSKAIGVSYEVCEKYISDCKLRNDAVEWIPYGVEAASSISFFKDSGELKLVYVGRIEEEQKRISDLIKIVRELSRQNIRFHLKVIGDGPEMSKFKNQLDEEIKAGKVELLGWQKGSDVIKLLRQSEIFILTSAYEGFCIALTEAVANGCCAVVTDIRSGNKQIVDEGQNGFMVGIGRVDLFIEKLKWLSLNADALLSMRNKARLTGEKYSIERMVLSYEYCFTKAIDYAKTEQRQTDYYYPLMETCRSKYPGWLRAIKMHFKK